MINPKGAFPTLLKYLPMNIVNHMANWKVIALVSGNIEAVSGPAAQDRPGPRSELSGKGQPLTKLDSVPAGRGSLSAKPEHRELTL